MIRYIERYKCYGTDKKGPKSWYGNIRRMAQRNNMIEMDVDARSSYFHIIVGQTDKYRFLCVPNWGIGTDIVELYNRRWNLEHLKNLYPEIHEVDLISIVDCLKVIDDEF